MNWKQVIWADSGDMREISLKTVISFYKDKPFDQGAIESAKTKALQEANSFIS